MKPSKQPYTKQSPYDRVYHPNYYERPEPTIINGKIQTHNIEPVDFLESLLATPEFNGLEGWLTGQVIKYLSRFPMKNGLEDLEKAQFYLQRLIDHEKTQANLADNQQGLKIKENYMTKPDINQTKIDLKDLKKLQTDLKHLYNEYTETHKFPTDDPWENENFIHDTQNIKDAENYLQQLIDKQQGTSASK